MGMCTGGKAPGLPQPKFEENFDDGFSGTSDSQNGNMCMASNM